MNKRIPIAAQLQNKKDETPNPVTLLLQFIVRHFDFMQILPMLALMGIGALFIYGTGQQVGGLYAEVFWKRQILYMGIGLVVWLSMTFIDYRWLAPASFLLYPFAIFLLVYVLVYGTPIFGAKRWIDFFGLNIQPSEVAKLAVLLSLAWLLSYKKSDVNKIHWAALAAAIAAVPFLLIVKEPDLGTALVLLVFTAAMIFTARLKWRYIIILLVALSAMIPIGYKYALKDYQRERILVFLDPDRDPQDRGWNQLQAEMAVGSGGLAGKGFMQGMHCTLGYLPKTVANSDFIFPVIAEETGLLGTLFLLLMYTLLVFSILRTAILAPDPFGRFLCVGIAMIIILHTFINIGMCIRLAPVTGLPLPLVSYGGTFMVITMTMLGITQSVYSHRNTKSIIDI